MNANLYNANLYNANLCNASICNANLWNTLKNEVRTISTEYPVFIYVCVGGASHLNPEIELLPQDYHQFPPFLQAMRNTYPELHFVLLLIDTLQECPPRVARDYSLQEMPESDQTFYKNQDGTMRAFVIKNTVYTDIEKELFNIENAINITNELKDLTDFARYNDLTLLYDTFTGRPVSIVAENYDMDNKNHLQQIVYGIGGRDNHGCQVDLTQPIAYYPYRLEKKQYMIRPMIKLYNFYKYIVNNDYKHMEYDLIQYPREMHVWTELHKNKIIENSVAGFKNIHLSVLRELYRAIHKNNENNHHPNFNYLPLIYRGLFDELYNQTEYSLLNELFSNYLESELEIIIHLKNLAITGEQMLNMITDGDDPYKWYDNLNNMIKVINV
jgi:hypothetical protein